MTRSLRWLRPLRWLLVACSIPAALGVARAADDPAPPPTPAADRLAAARAEVAARRWPAALAELRRVNATSSADWQNLMGFALRKGTPPDLEGAQRHYDAALRIDPRHRGALEYAGELALMKGELARAEELLARLEAACPSACEERDDLRRAVARFKAAGNRYVP